MNPQRLYRVACGLLLVSLAFTPAFSAVVYSIKVTNYGDAGQTHEDIEMFAEGEFIKMGMSVGGAGTDSEVIFRSDRGEMIIVDHANEGYFVMDAEMVDGIADQVKQALAQMQESLKDMPEAQRAMVEQMMKQQMPGIATQEEQPESELRKTGEEATHKGYPCVKYEIWRDGSRIHELWVTDWNNVKGSAQIAKTFESMALFFNELLAAIPSLGDSGSLAVDDNVFSQMHRLNGFPVVSRTFIDDALDNETTLESVTERDLGPNAFEPPKGYVLRTMGQM